MTKVELILNSTQFSTFKQIALQRLYEKEQYPLSDKEAIMKHLTRKFAELYLEHYHGNDRALKKEAVDLANISMTLFLILDGFAENDCSKQSEAGEHGKRE